jgi:pimeloyl-ACP methyl ester carboxylesterase
VRAPTLIVSAEDDLFGIFDVARYTAAEIPGARFIGYAEGGHLLVGHDREVMAGIEAFLR